MNTHEPRLRRGLILLTVYEQYPAFLNDKVIHRAVGTLYAGDMKELARDLSYLVECELITERTERVASLSIRSFKLTTDGVDVAQGSVEHPGVHIERV